MTPPEPAVTQAQRRKRIWMAVALVALIAALLFLISHRAQFIAGGALVNLGYRLQDPLDDYDLERHAHLAPPAIWNELRSQNHLSSLVRKRFPRTPRHPLVALVACMDARVDTSELMGDTRKYYYVIRTAGSVIGEHEEDMLELSVENGVKVVVITTHTDCAAEKVAADPEKRKHYPMLAAGVDEREQRIRHFMARPAIAKRLASGDLLVKRVKVDTATGELVAH